MIDTAELKAKPAIDLNAPLVETGYLGKIKPRPALAHPRSLTVTNDGDKDDADESILVTEYFGQQFAELQCGWQERRRQQDRSRLHVQLNDYSVKTIGLGPLTDIGFKDTNGEAAAATPTSCSRSRCCKTTRTWSRCVRRRKARKASRSRRPLARASRTAWRPSSSWSIPCATWSRQGAAPVCQDVANFKTATSPVVSVIDIKAGKEVVGAAQNLNADFDTFFKQNKVDHQEVPAVRDGPRVRARHRRGLRGRQRDRRGVPRGLRRQQRQAERAWARPPHRSSTCSRPAKAPSASRSARRIASSHWSRTTPRAT